MPRDHYIPLRRLTPARMSCFAIGFSLLGTTEYPQTLSQLLRFLPIGYNRISVPLFQQDKLTRVFLVSQQAITYRTRDDTYCPGVSTPKIRSLADSSMTIHITWWIPTISIIPNLLKSHHRSSPRSNHISVDGRPNTLIKTQVKLNII
jgi:hypothetical protein